MKLIKRISAAALLGSVMFSQTAFAATTGTTPAEVTIQGGALGIVVPASSIDFGTISIDGTVKTLTSNLDNMTIEDFTGTGNGWNVTVQSSQFTDGVNTLPSSSLELKGIDTITPLGTTSPLPTVSGIAPYAIDGGSALKILSSATNQGMGKFDVAFLADALELTIDTNTVKTTGVPYQSTITWTLVTGP